MKIPVRVALALVLLMVSVSLAQGPDYVVSTQRVFQVFASNGRERLVDANHATVRPGDLLEYQVTYQNVSHAKVDNLLGRLPIPKGMTFVSGSATPLGVFASLDDKTYEPAPLKKTIFRNGVKVEELLPVSSYRFLRWSLGSLKPGESVVVKARVRVN